jgi:hypothetical protein
MEQLGSRNRIPAPTVMVELNEPSMSPSANLNSTAKAVPVLSKQVATAVCRAIKVFLRTDFPFSAG